MEDWEKKYEELFGHVQDFHKRFSDQCSIKKEMEECIPELVESEDERLRKKCIELIKRVIPSGNNQSSESKDILDCIAYLEKQRPLSTEETELNSIAFLEQLGYTCIPPGAEQKPALYWHKIKANDHLPCRAYIYKFAYEQENNFHGRATINGYLVPNEPVTIGCDTWYLPVEDIKNLPKEEDLDTVSPMKTVEQKPALRLVGDGLISDPNSHFELEGEQKPTEWSEEDENVIETLIRELRLNAQFEFAVRKLSLDYVQTLTVLDKCRRLCPRPHWKPSEEQMDILDKVYHYLWADRNATADMQDGLGDFIDELKEL